jgi:hypothetical protein
VEPAGNKEEKMLNYDIGIALGEISIHFASVEDPDPQDTHVFWPPGSRSICQRYGSGSGAESGSFPFLVKGVEQTEIFITKYSKKLIF